MCVTIYNKNVYIETIGELKTIMPVLVIDPLYSFSEKNPIKDTHCLCPVDIEATAEKNSFHIMKDDIGDYIILEDIN